MSRGKAYRIHQKNKAVAKVKKLKQVWNDHKATAFDDPRWVGVMASTHRRPCSCSVCRPEKYRDNRKQFNWRKVA